MFLPKHPLIRPKMEDVLRAEQKLDVEALLEEAMLSSETVRL